MRALLLALLGATVALAVPHERRATASNAGWNGQTTNVQTGKTGVSAMQLSVVGPNSVVIIDKTEANPLKARSTAEASADAAAQRQLRLGAMAERCQWTHDRPRPPIQLVLRVRRSSLARANGCRGGSFLSNGTLLNLGASPSSD